MSNEIKNWVITVHADGPTIFRVELWAECTEQQAHAYANQIHNSWLMMKPKTTVEVSRVQFRGLKKEDE